MINVKEYILPSNGFLGYDKKVNIRGMKGYELSTAMSSLTEAAMNKIIESVIEPTISADMLCDEDKFFILHMARVQTFGDEISQAQRCPFCGDIHTYDINYKDFKVKYIESEEEVSGEKEYTWENKVKGTKHKLVVKKKVPTADDFTAIKLYQEKHNPSPDFAAVLLMISRIKYIIFDGKKYTTISELLNLLLDLNGVIFLEVSDFIKTEFGLDTTFVVDCKKCKTAITGGIGINADLFRNTYRVI